MIPLFDILYYSNVGMKERHIYLPYHIAHAHSYINITIIIPIYCYNAKFKYSITLLITLYISIFVSYLFGLLAMFVGSDEWCFFAFIITTGDIVG